MHDVQTAVWPKWKWAGSSWWFTVAGSIAGAAVILWPSVISGPFNQRVAAVLLSFVCAPIAVLVILYVVRLLAVMIRRSLEYSNVTELLRATQDELQQARAILAAVIENQQHIPRFEIGSVVLYQGSVTILIRFALATLSVGDSVCVVDTEDEVLFGHFEVKEVKSDGYRAATISINPLWLGYLLEKNESETPAPPAAGGISSG